MRTILTRWTTLHPAGGCWGFFCFFFLWEIAVWPRGRDLSYNWNFLGSFYCTLKLKQDFALGSFSLPHPQAEAVSDAEKRFIKVWGEITYLLLTVVSFFCLQRSNLIHLFLLLLVWFGICCCCEMPPTDSVSLIDGWSEGCGWQQSL